MGLHQRYADILSSPSPIGEGWGGAALLSKEREDEIRRQLTVAFDDMMRVLYKQQGAQLSVEVMATPKVQEFVQTHASALDSSFQQVPMSENMRQRLQRSDYIFSGLKAFHELNEAFPSLLDENGNRKPFEQFLNDVRKIDRTYNANYLRAEYNFAHSSASMAAKWEEFAEDGDRYNLQYRTANDNKVRPEHAALDGVTLPFSDPFWETYYPPNGWNCRCTVIQVRKSKYPTTPRDEAMARGEEALQRDTKGIFHFNPGKQQKAFPDYNPYTIRRCNDCDMAKGDIKLARAFVPENQLCAACKLIHACQQEREQKQRRYEELLADQNYKDVRFDPATGAIMATHIKHNNFDKDDDERFFGQFTGTQLEQRCQLQLFRMGREAILCAENDLKQSNGTGYYASLDLSLDGKRMDIRSVIGQHCGGQLWAKNGQLGRYNARPDVTTPADSVCLYYEKPELYNDANVRRDILWYKEKIAEFGAVQRIKHVIVVVRGKDDYITYDI